MLVLSLCVSTQSTSYCEHCNHKKHVTYTVNIASPPLCSVVFQYKFSNTIFLALWEASYKGWVPPGKHEVSKLSYSYTTVRVWYRSYYTSTRRSRVQVLITMISYEYIWYNWLVPCQKNWNQHFSKHLLYFAKQRSIYSIRAVGKSIELTVLLEYIDLFYSNKLICAPRSHSCSIPGIKLTAEDTNWGMNNEGMRAIRWHNYSSLALSNRSLLSRSVKGRVLP